MSLKLDFKELRIYRRTIFTVFIFCMTASFSFFAMQGMEKTSAASATNFRAGNIISDAVMGNYNTMSKDDIQRFLTSKNPCNDYDYNKYLRLKSAYPNNSWHFENGHFVCLSEERFGDGETIGSGQTAAEIIYQAAQDYKINPQVLLVLLQKEQGLITDTYPNKIQYRAATGFGCPDTAACSTKYYGFKNQIRNAASMFRDVLNGGWSNYPAYKTVYIQYNPNSGCGGSNVYIENRATSALYRYTPYQPNASALNAGYGTGDVCGAYGNRNFYLYFADWFGDPHVRIDGEAVVVPDGVYQIAPKGNSQQSLEVHNAGRHNGANAQLWARQYSNSYRWQISRENNGYYVIKNVNSGLVLDLNAADTSSGTNIQTYTYNGTCAQQWKIYRTSDNYYTFESACSPTMVVDMAAASTNNGTNVQLYVANNSNAQKWSLQTGKTIDDGIYTVRSHNNNQYGMDVAGASKNNGANTQVYSSNTTMAQKWQFQYNAAEDYYTITNPVSGKALDVEAAVFKNGTKVQMYSANSSCAQRWRILDTGNNQRMIVSACAVDKIVNPDGNRITNDAKLLLADYQKNTTSYYWDFIKVQSIKDGVYTVRSDLAASKPVVVDVSANGTKDGTNIQVWEYDASTLAQQWRIKHNTSDDTYSLINPKSNKALDVSGARMINSANINLYSSNSTCAQKWRILEDGKDKYTFLSACNQNYVLDISGAGTKNGTNLQLYQHNGTSAQKWNLVTR